MQNHTAVGRVVSTLEATFNVHLPHQKMINAYLHFEAMSDHKYQYSCVHCGYYPPVLVMDLNKKGAFRLAGIKYIILFEKLLLLPASSE